MITTCVCSNILDLISSSVFSLFLMVSFTHAYSTSLRLHFHHLRRRELTVALTAVKTEAAPADVTMHRRVTMRVKGWNSRNDQITAAVNLTNPSIRLVYLPPKGLSCFARRLKLSVVLIECGRTGLWVKDTWMDATMAQGAWTEYKERTSVS